MRFHSIEKCYRKVVVRVPINLREFFAIFKVKVKKKKWGWGLMNFKNIENYVKN